MWCVLPVLNRLCHQMLFALLLANIGSTCRSKRLRQSFERIVDAACERRLVVSPYTRLDWHGLLPLVNLANSVGVDPFLK